MLFNNTVFTSAEKKKTKKELEDKVKKKLSRSFHKEIKACASNERVKDTEDKVRKSNWIYKRRI